MYAPAGVKTSPDFPIPETMRAWVLGDPGELRLADKPTPTPRCAEVLLRIEDAIKVVVKARRAPALQRQAAE